MANICLYKIKVKGTKKACYALVNMMPLYSGEKEYLDEDGTDDAFTLVFKGDCKWAVDCYTSPLNDPKPFTEEELDAVGDGNHWGVTLKDKSVLLNCEIFCNSKDIDDSCWSVYVHYDRGREVRDECPKELHIKRGRDYDCWDDVVVPVVFTPTVIGRKCKVKFEKGTYLYSGEYEVGDIVNVDGAKSGELGRVIGFEDGVDVYSYLKITDKVGHADPFVEADIEAVWKSFKPKDRKGWLVKFGLDEAMTKKKFITTMDYKWTKYAAKNNDWNKFVEDVKNCDWDLAKL